MQIINRLDFPGGSVVKNLPANTRDTGSIPGLRRTPGEGNGNPLQYSCLGNFMVKGAWRATYSTWGCKRVRHDLATKQQVTIRLNMQRRKDNLSRVTQPDILLHHSLNPYWGRSAKFIDVGNVKYIISSGGIRQIKKILQLYWDMFCIP